MPDKEMGPKARLRAARQAKGICVGCGGKRGSVTPGYITCAPCREKVDSYAVRHKMKVVETQAAAIVGDKSVRVRPLPVFDSSEIAEMPVGVRVAARTLVGVYTRAAEMLKGASRAVGKVIFRLLAEEEAKAWKREKRRA